MTLNMTKAELFLRRAVSDLATMILLQLLFQLNGTIIAISALLVILYRSWQYNRLLKRS